MTPGLRCTVILLLALTLMSVGDTAEAQPEPRLRLVETASWPPPDSFERSGVAASDAPNLLLWSRAVGQLILLTEKLDQRRYGFLPDGVRPRFAALVGDSSIEVIAEGSREIHRMSLAGGPTETRAIDAPESIIAAARDADGWIFLTRSPDGQLSLRRERWAQTGTRRSAGWVNGRKDGYAMIAGAEEIVLTQTARPHAVRVFDKALRLRRSFQPGADVLPRTQGKAAADSSPALWTSLAAIPLDRGYIQTIADLASDRRIVVLYDEVGNSVRATDLKVALGFTASVPPRRLLFASRRLNTVEIVRYEWCWTRTGPRSGNKEETC